MRELALRSGEKAAWFDRAAVSAAHAWDVTPAAARRIQRELAVRVSLNDPEAGQFTCVTGLDVHYFNDTAAAAAVTLSLPGLTVMETRRVESSVHFPYISGLLGFREIPPLLAVLERLEHPPELLLADGHGIAHPRRFGLASHLGVLLDRPTVGVARRLLWGSHASPGSAPGQGVRIEDQGQAIGAVLRTRRRVAPVYVSPGHLVSLGMAVRLATACLQGYRMPEPLRLADILSRKR